MSHTWPNRVLNMSKQQNNCHILWDKWLRSAKFRAILAAMSKKIHKSYRIRSQTQHRIEAIAATSEVLGEADVIDLSVAVLHQLLDSPDRAAETARTAKSVLMGLSELYGLKQIEKTGQPLLPFSKTKV